MLQLIQSMQAILVWCLQDSVAAALAMQIACELNPGGVYHAQELERLTAHIPTQLADILEV